MCTICALTIEFAVEHPQSLVVAVATRQAIETGLLTDCDTAEMDMVQSRHHATVLMTKIQQRLRDVLPISRLTALPNFFVLMIESRTWAYFHPTLAGFDTLADPAPPTLEPSNDRERDSVIVISQAAAESLVNGQLPFSTALQKGLAIVDAPVSENKSIESALTVAYPVGQFSRFVCTEII